MKDKEHQDEAKGIDKNALKPHSFDGIQEYDNQLPRWWINGFYLSILFAAVYFYYYELGGGPNLMESYRSDRLSEIEAQKAQAATKKSLSEDELLALAEKPTFIESGKKQFATKCASCHAADGGGLVGPNLTDSYWVHGNRVTDLVHVITRGVPTKGMPGWGTLMSEDEIIAAASYIKTLQGTKPLHPKAPEGDQRP